MPSSWESSQVRDDSCRNLSVKITHDFLILPEHSEFSTNLRTSAKGNSDDMETAVIYVIILGVISAATGQQVDVEPEVFSYPGQTVHLRCALINAAGNELTQVTWTYEPKEGNRTNIAVFRPNNDPHYPDSPVKGRVSFSPSPPNLDSPSIQISDVRMTDEGNYICSISTFPAGNRQGTTSLVMLEEVGKVTVTATDPVEFSSVSLSCFVSSGSSLSFLWLNGSSEVTASDRVQLTDGNTTLTIVSVTRYDQGPFRCHVFNAVSNGTSAPVNLSISFGPENINLTKSPSQDYYVEGSDISLLCSAVSRPAALFNWFLNRVPLSDTGPELRLINIKEDQSGNYSCQAFNNKTMRNETSQPSIISVLTRVSNVTVTASSTDLVEFSSVSLFCSSSGSSLSFLWLNGSSEVTASNRVQLTDGNTTLTIVSVTRYDQGPFRCHVFNPFSNGTSAPVNLSISFGPENIHLTKSPSQDYYVEGSDISLMCSAVSRPTALFNWFLNRVPLSDTGPELRLINIKEDQSGNYSCQAFNNKTMRNETSQPSIISVLKPIVNASVTSSPNQPVEGNSVKLTCEAAGSVFARKWMKDGADLIQTGRVLSFQSLKKTDSGKYSCNISNPVSSVEAEYIMVVNYGPENVQIKGPSTISLNENLTLTCSAESTPTANFTWKLNETKILNNSAVLTKHITDLSDSGEYTCEAMNRITEKTSSAVHGLTVTQYLPGKHGCLSAGAIAAIVITICFIAAGGAAGGYCIYKKKNKKDPPPHNTDDQKINTF
ncbi:carcinoembryonic antigen-related cell adhesion molecule 5-like isoform X2 [Seriola lalandi dorsalis]|uniref:carcinoembryonic antigen-related cell adhesion molecule 5-like isoform X2 n=1 Tax=Seriola lalandi dorsalis TaxID=1841481 RepID=UPI000C6FB92D|nr:carcinoembryonic antigen-related cell adhesion molecule 5-like isoform X2 [Seriola lalandi dorsalis]